LKTGSKRPQRKSRNRQKDNIKVDSVIVIVSSFGLDSSGSGKEWRKVLDKVMKRNYVAKMILSSQAKKQLV